jgi:protein-S-isoprenylcysteine O-methyltransferase Ste14
MLKNILKIFSDYKPPKKIRALFIIHYAPLILILLIGPITPIYGIWSTPVNFFLSISIGILILLLGIYLYFKWEIFWQKTYQGQLVTDGIFEKIRHPHYTSILLIGLGLAFFFNSITALLISVIAIPIMILSIFDEEKILIKQYGEKYKNFMKKTPWRIIPGIF